jgi:hypothetical protein
MTDRNKFEQMLESLVNDDQARAKELFHQIVVEKSREIYENLLAEEFDEDVEETREDNDMEESMADEDMEESMADEDMEEGMDEETEEGFDMSMEAEDDEMPMDGDKMSSMDKSDDFIDDVTGDTGSPQEVVADIGAAVDDLDALVAELENAIAAFDSSKEDNAEMDDEDDIMSKEQYAFEDEQMMREYVEKVGEAYKGGKVASTSEAGGANTKSILAKKNDMGGTTANIAKGGEGGGNKTSLPGHANAKTENLGNINVPGGKAGVKHLKGVPAGHGAEKKGSGDTATNKKSIIGSR